MNRLSHTTSVLWTFIPNLYSCISKLSGKIFTNLVQHFLGVGGREAEASSGLYDGCGREAHDHSGKTAGQTLTTESSVMGKGSLSYNCKETFFVYKFENKNNADDE